MMPTPRLVLRALARHWWQALILWVIGTGVLGVLVYLRYEPTYESSSLLQVEPNESTPFNSSLDRDLDSYLRTQVRLITSPAVLLEAAENPQVTAMPSIQRALDPEQRLRQMLDVQVEPGSYLIRVAAQSTSPSETATVVQAVVQSFLELDAQWSEAQTKGQIKRLEAYKSDLENQIEARAQALKDLVRRMEDPTQFLPGVAGSELRETPDSANDEGDSSRFQVTIQQYKDLQQQLFELDMNLIDAEASLETARRRLGAFDTQDWIKRQVRQQFLTDPEVQAAWDQLNALQAQLDEYRSRVRKGSDPSLDRIRNQYQQAKADYERLWRTKSPQIEAQLLASEANPERVVRALERQVQGLKQQRERTAKNLEQLELNTRIQGVDAIDRQLLKSELARLNNMKTAVSQRLEALEFQKSGQARIREVSEARPRSEPVSNKRTKYLAVTPLAVLGLVMGLMTLVEMRSGRVCDTRDLSARLPTEVFAVPPLPKAPSKTNRKLSGPSGSNGQLERFVQQLDHLRVALCGDGVSPGLGAGSGLKRCVLITSAVGGEGKTTLAAQLAVRCAEAGAKTVLIDADLRRAMLGRLFEVPECPGLSDVLRGEANLEDALVPISQIGGCHLLPAGSPDPHPNRTLRGQAFGPMLDRLRKSFDVVIVDTSPVLPVPDALILGRFADGAVLATRHDESRFPSVERANHLLTGAGIPVLGVVVNGARSDAYYNGYAYSYRPDRSPEAAAASKTSTDDHRPVG